MSGEVPMIGPIPDGYEEAVARQRTEFEELLRAAINRTCQENGSNTPDHILATYLLTCLGAFEVATNARTAWKRK